MMMIDDAVDVISHGVVDVMYTLQMLIYTFCTFIIIYIIS